MSIAYISKLLGHSDIRTTQIYLKVKTIELKIVLDYQNYLSNDKNEKGEPLLNKTQSLKMILDICFCLNEGIPSISQQ